MMRLLDSFCSEVRNRPYVRYYGTVLTVRRDSLRVQLPNARVGSLCLVNSQHGSVPVEIVSLDPQGHIAMPLDDLSGVQLGDQVVLVEEMPTLPVGEALLGQVIDSTCVPYLNNGSELRLPDRIPLNGGKLNPMDRELIRKPIDLGVRCLNACLTCGLGQRQGIFAGSGVGKSVLLGMMARYTSADIVVIGLIGERGREVREFLEHELGPEGRKRAVVVVETADKSAVRRARGASAAVAVAEYFRSRGANVLLMMDSLTRFAMAQREIGLAAGEPPTTKGYPPSVFSSLSRLVERAGNWGEQGSVTGLYTVLVEGDDLEDPIADAARAILDGHIVLSRKLANRGQYPAVDILASVSRVMDQITTPEHQRAARQLKMTLAKYLENEDAITYGMYQRGSDPTIDEAIALTPRINEFLRQGREIRAPFGEARGALNDMMAAG